MELLYGTTNPGKLDAMSRALAPLGLTLVGLRGLGLPIPAVEEEGNTILENDEQKARAYYKAFGRPVFSCDSGLYFDELPEAEQPGLHVRRVNGRSLTDAEAQEYYGAMARRHGGRLTARFRNAIFLTVDGDTCFSSADESLASPPFWLVEKPHPRHVEGFPLDAMSVDPATGRYHYDMGETLADSAETYRGFQAFFQNILPVLRERL